ncbi:MAG: hypothetical protein IJ224_05805 [Lachnospiraceae bacterium]|nr:hypothetical protein [Lachnospiraceae bacterium]
MMNLKMGICYLEKEDLDMIEKVDSSLCGDELCSVVGSVSISDMALTMIRPYGCSEYDLIRNASILSLIAVRSCVNNTNKFGYNVSISRSDTVKENYYISVDGMNVIHICDDWDDGGWKILFLNPAFINDPYNDNMLKAVIKAYC